MSHEEPERAPPHEGVESPNAFTLTTPLASIHGHTDRLLTLVVAVGGMALLYQVFNYVAASRALKW